MESRSKSLLVFASFLKYHKLRSCSTEINSRLILRKMRYTDLRYTHIYIYILKMYTTTINLTEYLQFSFDYYFSLIYATNQLFQSSVQFNNRGIYLFITDIKILYFLLHALPPYLELLVFITMGFAVKTTQVEVFIWISSCQSL